MPSLERIQLPVEPSADALLRKPLPIGRVAEKRTALLLQGQLLQVHLPKWDPAGKARLLQVTLRQFQRTSINIGARNVLNTVRIHFRLAPGPNSCTRSCGNESKTLHRKGSLEPWRTVGCPEGSLNQQRSCAAAWVMQRHAWTPRAQLHQGRGQRFSQRSLSVPCPVAASGQRFSRSIQQHPDLILMNGDQDGKAIAGFRKDRHGLRRAQFFDNRFFGDGLTVPGTHQPASGALGRDKNLLVSLQKMLPADSKIQLKQFLKAGTALLRQQQKNPVAEPEAQIAQHDFLHGSLESYTPILCPHLLDPEPLQFGRDQPLQAEGSGGKTIELFFCHVLHILIFLIHFRAESCSHSNRQIEESKAGQLRPAGTAASYRREESLDF